MSTDLKMITIVMTTYIKGKVFKPQEQYCYTEKVDILIGCGCGGKKRDSVPHYRVVLDGGVAYDIPADRVVESDVVIPCEDRDFLTARANIGDTNRVEDFNPFRNNLDPNEIAARANNVPM